MTRITFASQIIYYTTTTHRCTQVIQITDVCGDVLYSGCVSRSRNSVQITPFAYFLQTESNKFDNILHMHEFS